MALVLYCGNKRYSSWSLRAYLALAHTGAPFDVRTVWLDREDTQTELAKIGPASRVPVLHDGSLVIWDSLAICEYVAEVFPAAQLWPAETARRARARSIACEMHSGFAAIRRDMSMDLLGQRHGVGHTPDALADAARAMAIWRNELDHSGGPFLFGEFTIADAMFAPVTTRLVTYGVARDAAVQRYIDTIAELPAFTLWRDGATTEPELPDHH